MSQHGGHSLGPRSRHPRRLEGSAHIWAAALRHPRRAGAARWLDRRMDLATPPQAPRPARHRPRRNHASELAAAEQVEPRARHPLRDRFAALRSGATPRLRSRQSRPPPSRGPSSPARCSSPPPATCNTERRSPRRPAPTTTPPYPTACNESSRSPRTASTGGPRRSNSSAPSSSTSARSPPTRTTLGIAQERHWIWAPDLLGSICFLVASWLAFAEAAAGGHGLRHRSLGWWISAINLLGSIAFGASAIGARYLRTTGEIANLSLANLGTFAGAVCFLIGAALLPVESARRNATA